MDKATLLTRLDKAIQEISTKTHTIDDRLEELQQTPASTPQGREICDLIKTLNQQVADVLLALRAEVEGED